MGASSLTRSVHSHSHHRLQILRHFGCLEEMTCTDKMGGTAEFDYASLGYPGLVLMVMILTAIWCFFF